MRVSFTEFLKNNYYELVAERVREYIEGCGGELQELELGLGCINVYDLPRLEVGFDIAVKCDYSVYDRYDDEAEEKQDMLLVQGRLDLGRKGYGASVNSIGVYAGMPRREYLFNDSLIPCLNDLQCMEVANRMLGEFYPEHLQKPGTLNVDLLIQRMGLQVARRTISRQGVKSQIMLLDGEFEGEHYGAGTIIVDGKKSMEHGFASCKFNLVHECVHWFCHRKQALLASLLSEQNLSAEADFEKFVGFEGSFIETQTNKIAGMVLAPGQTLTRFADVYLTGFLAPNKQEDYLGVVRGLLEDVSFGYGISKACAKIRLQQCGVELAEGFNNYVDGPRVRDYVFNPEALPENDTVYTFTISEADACLVAEDNPKIKGYLETGVLVYVENHIVVNSPRFIEDGEDGYILTDYALTHMDECALRFYTWVTMLPNEAGGASLSRRNGGNSVAFCLLDKELNVESMLDKKTIEAVLKELDEMKEGDFQHNLNVILKNRNVKHSHLQDVIDKGERTIARMFSSKYEPKRDDVLHVCLALKISWEVSNKLLRSAGIFLNANKKSDATIIRVLTYCTGWSYARKLELLAEHNILL